MEAPTRIVFLILPKIHLLDFAGPLQVFHEAVDYGVNVSLEYCSIGQELLTATRFPLGRLRDFSEVPLNTGDYLIIPGADVDFLISKFMMQQEELNQWVRNGHDAGCHICSICSGAFFLAGTGLLDGKRCTTHWKRTDQLKRSFPKLKVEEDVLFTEDRGIYTSAGVTAGVDLALHLVSKLADEHVAHQVARELVVYLRRGADESQQSIFMKYRNHIHSGIHRVQDFVYENIQKKVSLVHLADKACMSPRNLTRIFKKETGVTLNQYTTSIRKEMLRQFVKNSDMSRKQMARMCGLKSERQVIRLLSQTAWPGR
jgi:transcriptional regulator GlxA family with amidase domain